MKRGLFRIRGLFLITPAIFAIGLIGFGGCSAGAANTPAIPSFVAPEAPLKVTADQLYQEYTADEEVANAKYEGKRLLFSNVVVEKINNTHFDPETGNVRDVYIVNGSVEFRARYWIDVALIKAGFVVDIVGEPRGLFGIEEEYLVVENCRVFIMEGDLDFDFREVQFNY